MKHTFTTDIFSVETEEYPLVVLINGDIFRISDSTLEIVCSLKETVKHVQRIRGIVYVCTSTSIYEVINNSLSKVYQSDLSNISALDISEDKKYICIGTYDGALTLINTETKEEEELEPHEDAVVGIIIKTRTIYTASEDGIIYRTKILKKEPEDVYGIKRPIRYFGVHGSRITIIDSKGSLYAMNQKQNDFTEKKSVLSKVDYVFRINSSLFTMYNHKVEELNENRKTIQHVHPEAFIEGIFLYNNKIHPYKGNTIFEWKTKQEGEIDDFFEDL
ncbi:hypothetical protein NEFER03_1308 [Nematocida sp. LUAm3]|nr:hypothetical protein NEFER03_1308 [Nematocida sp. LUAm3]KAI5174070.1 hypothetical protein NEFER02_0537 [Nematocida sp. LUAm2]KAI5177187.1 hypothetical protein NEFER01_0462 [Nematocida sp. LUAm1]